jgi:hypothetical protein
MKKELSMYTPSPRDGLVPSSSWAYDACAVEAYVQRAMRALARDPLNVERQRDVKHAHALALLVRAPATDRTTDVDAEDVDVLKAKVQDLEAALDTLKCVAGR